MQSSGPVVYQQFVRDSRRWDGFAFRPGDIVISTPAKSGTTWTQMICALLVFQSPRLERGLDRLSPWLDMVTRPLDDVLGDLAAQTHRRFIKTHTPLDGLPFDDRVTYICTGRDPRDVAMSWEHHRANQNRSATHRARAAALGVDHRGPLGPGPPLRPVHPHDRFWAWADDPTPANQASCTLGVTMHHLGTFWAVRDRPNVIMLHYADLLADLDGQMRRLSARLGIPVDEDRWPALVDAAGLARMRDRADQLAPNATERIWLDNRQFFHRATSGQWQEFLGAHDLRRYRARVDMLAGPDLAGWLHRDAC